MSMKTLTVSEASQQLSNLVREMESPVGVTVQGKPVAVLVAFESYEALLEQIEDLEDSLDVLLRRDEPAVDWPASETESTRVSASA